VSGRAPNYDGRMDVSPKTLREVEFREKMRGYHPEDVDQFLERVAAGMEILQDRLRQAMERAQRAEQAAAEAGGTDDTLRRTLVLAQRTADLAVQEAREQAARILAGAEQQAQGLLAEAEERAQRAQDDALMETKSELTRLEASRQHLQDEVDTLTQWVQEHRAHLSLSLQEALARIEQADLLSPPPASRGVDAPASRSPSSRPSEPEGPGLPAPAQESDAGGPATAAWQLGSDAQPAEGEARSAGARGDSDPYFAELRRAVDQPQPLGPRDEESALDPAGEDGGDQYYDPDAADGRRLGGRLRRRH
jgi:cell division initiation protein